MRPFILMHSGLERTCSVPKSQKCSIEGLVKKLSENGVTIVDSIAEFDYGKFVHIMDLEGNKIELWEPIDSFLTNIGGPTTK